MKNSHIIKILKTLTKKELILFERLLLSPYFTEGKNIRSRLVIKYFHLLKKFYPSFDSKNLTKEYLYSKLYPRTKYNDATFRKINSDLFKLGEIFLIQLDLYNNETQSKKSLVKQSTERNIEMLFVKSFKSVLKHLESVVKDDEYYYDTYSVWIKYFSFYYGKKSIYKIENSVDNINNFFIYSIIVSLRTYLWWISNSRIMNIEKEFMMYEETLDYVGRNLKLFANVPPVLSNYYLIMLIRTKDETYFSRLKELKVRHFHSLNNIDKQNFLIMTTNFCYDMILSGKEKFRRERFELDKEHFELAKKISPAGAHPFFFLSAGRNANRIKEFGWVEKNLKEFERYSFADNKEFMINFIRADLLFHKKQFEDSIRYLSKIKTQYSFEKQNIRNLMIQIYYETSNFESALSLIDAGRHFLRRDKHLVQRLKLHSLEFAKYAEKLILLKLNGDKKDTELLRTQISGSNGLLDKDWLLDKLNFLEKKS